MGPAFVFWALFALAVATPSPAIDDTKEEEKVIAVTPTTKEQMMRELISAFEAEILEVVTPMNSPRAATAVDSPNERSEEAYSQEEIIYDRPPRWRRLEETEDDLAETRSQRTSVESADEPASEVVFNNSINAADLQTEGEDIVVVEKGVSDTVTDAAKGQSNAQIVDETFVEEKNGTELVVESHHYESQGEGLTLNVHGEEDSGESTVLKDEDEKAVFVTVQSLDNSNIREETPIASPSSDYLCSFLVSQGHIPGFCTADLAARVFQNTKNLNEACHFFLTRGYLPYFCQTAKQSLPSFKLNKGQAYLKSISPNPTFLQQFIQNGGLSPYFPRQFYPNYSPVVPHAPFSKNLTLGQIVGGTLAAGAGLALLNTVVNRPRPVYNNGVPNGYPNYPYNPNYPNYPYNSNYQYPAHAQQLVYYPPGVPVAPSYPQPQQYLPNGQLYPANYQQYVPVQQQMNNYQYQQQLAQYQPGGTPYEFISYPPSSTNNRAMRGRSEESLPNLSLVAVSEPRPPYLPFPTVSSYQPSILSILTPEDIDRLGVKPCDHGVCLENGKLVKLPEKCLPVFFFSLQSDRYFMCKGVEGPNAVGITINEILNNRKPELTYIENIVEVETIPGYLSEEEQDIGGLDYFSGDTLDESVTEENTTEIEGTQDSTTGTDNVEDTTTEYYSETNVNEDTHTDIYESTDENNQNNNNSQILPADLKEIQNFETNGARLVNISEELEEVKKVIVEDDETMYFEHDTKHEDNARGIEYSIENGDEEGSGENGQIVNQEEEDIGSGEETDSAERVKRQLGANYINHNELLLGMETGQKITPNYLHQLGYGGNRVSVGALHPAGIYLPGQSVVELDQPAKVYGTSYPFLRPELAGFFYGNMFGRGSVGIPEETSVVARRRRPASALGIGGLGLTGGVSSKPYHHIYGPFPPPSRPIRPHRPHYIHSTPWYNFNWREPDQLAFIHFMNSRSQSALNNGIGLPVYRHSSTPYYSFPGHYTSYRPILRPRPIFPGRPAYKPLGAYKPYFNGNPYYKRPTYQNPLPWTNYLSEVVDDAHSLHKLTPEDRTVSHVERIDNIQNIDYTLVGSGQDQKSPKELH